MHNLHTMRYERALARARIHLDEFMMFEIWINKCAVDVSYGRCGERWIFERKGRTDGHGPASSQNRVQTTNHWKCACRFGVAANMRQCDLLDSQSASPYYHKSRLFIDGLASLKNSFSLNCDRGERVSQNRMAYRFFGFCAKMVRTCSNWITCGRRAHSLHVCECTHRKNIV